MRWNLESEMALFALHQNSYWCILFGETIMVPSHQWFPLLWEWKHFLSCISVSGWFRFTLPHYKQPGDWKKMTQSHRDLVYWIPSWQLAITWSQWIRQLGSKKTQSYSILLLKIIMIEMSALLIVIYYLIRKHGEGLNTGIRPNLSLLSSFCC